MSDGSDPLPPLAGEEHVCRSCGLAYAEVTVADAAGAIQRLPGDVRSAVTGIPVPALAARPASGVWSVTEYVCHLRDVYVVFTIRLHRARTERLPVLEPMFNDLRARRFRYRERAIGPVLDELAAAVRGFGEEIARMPPDGWDRQVTRLPGELRTARWLVRQALHEGVHHLADIRAIGAGTLPPGSG